MSELIDRLLELVTANRILAHEGVVDAFGHISVRTPGAPDRFIMSRSRSPELVTLDDAEIVVRLKRAGYTKSDYVVSP